MRCSAVLLAGGKSTRMGCDKALLDFEGQPLWRRQLNTLHRLSPQQLMIAAPPREEWSGYEVIADIMANAGPLAGVAGALRRCATSHLVVLAIDLPNMTADFLRGLLVECTEEQGIVPCSPAGFEPLAAVYPADCAALAMHLLRRGEYSMQQFVQLAIAQGRMCPREIAPNESELFLNLNTPADYERFRDREVHPNR